jgi:hypothetical protein
MAIGRRQRLSSWASADAATGGGRPPERNHKCEHVGESGGLGRRIKFPVLIARSTHASSSRPRDFNRIFSRPFAGI